MNRTEPSKRDTFSGIATACQLPVARTTRPRSARFGGNLPHLRNVFRYGACTGLTMRGVLLKLQRLVNATERFGSPLRSSVGTPICPNLVSQE